MNIMLKRALGEPMGMSDMVAGTLSLITTGLAAFALVAEGDAQRDAVVLAGGGALGVILAFLGPNIRFWLKHSLEIRKIEAQARINMMSNNSRLADLERQYAELQRLDEIRRKQLSKLRQVTFHAYEAIQRKRLWMQEVAEKFHVDLPEGFGDFRIELNDPSLWAEEIAEEGNMFMGRPKPTDRPE